MQLRPARITASEGALEKVVVAEVIEAAAETQGVRPTRPVMDPRQLFFDERFRGMCAYCGKQSTTADHVPSKVLLDEPFPADLGVVDACFECNNGLSTDEEYVACMIECALTGEHDPAGVRRSKVRDILHRSPALARRIAESRVAHDDGRLVWTVETDRVRRVVLKLARGHVAHQFAEPALEEPVHLWFAPLAAMSDEQFAAFQVRPSLSVAFWPEVGSRAFIDAVRGRTPTAGEWTVVQLGRYRYALTSDQGVNARMIISEYLACEATWE